MKYKTKKLGRTTFTNVESLPDFPGLYIQRFPERAQFVIRSENDEDIARIVVTKLPDHSIAYDLFGGSLTRDGAILHLRALRAALDQDTSNLLNASEIRQRKTRFKKKIRKGK